MISRTLLRLVLRLVFRVEMTGDTSVFVAALPCEATNSMPAAPDALMASSRACE